jgi:RND family efflux transporter MFP subunit
MFRPAFQKVRYRPIALLLTMIRTLGLSLRRLEENRRTFLATGIKCNWPQPTFSSPSVTDASLPGRPAIGMLSISRAKPVLFYIVTILAGLLTACGDHYTTVQASPESVPLKSSEVGVVKVVRSTLQQTLTVSSELVPFQQIDVYAKESGFVRELYVDFGTHVRVGQVMAVLEIPELQLQLQQDQAAVKDAANEVSVYQQDLNKVEAQQNVTHLQYTRLYQVAQNRPGLVAQQEVDDWHGKDLAADSQVAAARSSLESAKSRLDGARAKLRYDEAIFDYSKITAPFSGVVTQRYANYGTLMQSGVGSSTQALPLVQLSEDDLFRLVIPVPESYVPGIRVGDPVNVRLPSLKKTLPGKVTRFSVDVKEDTRTMHTEVDVRNPDRVLMPGMYAEATLTMNLKKGVVAVPPQIINIEGDRRSAWVVDSAGRVEHRPVTLGVETPNQVEVLSGLSEGELVAAGDRSRLKDGETVRPKIVQLLKYDGQ